MHIRERHNGGLSGIATAALVYFCLHGLTETGPWKALCLFVLAGVGVKLILEFTLPGFTAINVGKQPFVPVPLSHAIGVVIAIGTFLSIHLSERAAQTGFTQPF